MSLFGGQKEGISPDEAVTRQLPHSTLDIQFAPRHRLQPLEAVEIGEEIAVEIAVEMQLKSSQWH